MGSGLLPEIVTMKLNSERRIQITWKIRGMKSHPGSENSQQKKHR
jgi:hypothetical protein